MEKLDPRGDHRYTLTARDFDRLYEGKELIAECDRMNEENHTCYKTAIKITWAFRRPL